MTIDTLSPPRPTTPEASTTRTAAAERGITEIAARVVEKLAVRLATEVPGVVDHQVGGWRGALPGASASTTSADAQVSQSQAEVALSIDVRYPTPVTEVVEGVRTHVHDGLLRLTGLRTTRLDVTIRHLVTDRPARARVL